MKHSSMQQKRTFPALSISRERVRASGGFAEAQAAFLSPDPDSIAQLRQLLDIHQVGLVAHFYMDPELQGVISATGHPLTHISDSLVMADRAVDMVRAGAKQIVVLGVDFMAENVRAVLDGAGFSSVPVYRVQAEAIGCSLASAAEAPAYFAWLDQASQVRNSLHVVYINTSLYTKALAHKRVPTITCTSSNVVRTVLAAFTQIPDLSVWFGPDSYMGHNLLTLFRSLASLPPGELAERYPGHDPRSIARLIERFHFYELGNCIVHHLFSDKVAQKVRDNYKDAFITAHLEVPGAMFELGLEAQREGRGVVGSTSDILTFVGNQVDGAVRAGKAERKTFVLGTETGMVTALVRRIQSALACDSEGHVEVEIVFPVAADAVTTTDQPDLPIVPGPMQGEGCGVEGGCATCPYMKMNSLDALMSLLGRLGSADPRLSAFVPKMHQGTLDGRGILDWAVEPIHHMRAFARTGKLPEVLVQDVQMRLAP